MTCDISDALTANVPQRAASMPPVIQWMVSASVRNSQQRGAVTSVYQAPVFWMKATPMAAVKVRFHANDLNHKQISLVHFIVLVPHS